VGDVLGFGGQDTAVFLFNQLVQVFTQGSCFSCSFCRTKLCHKMICLANHWRHFWGDMTNYTKRYGPRSCKR
jgi:hypothetical protein